MITRYFLIALTVGIAIYRLTQGAWLASSGLLAMAAGLVVLRLAERKPAIRPVAYACFAVTAVAIGIILVQGRQ